VSSPAGRWWLTLGTATFVLALLTSLNHTVGPGLSAHASGPTPPSSRLGEGAAPSSGAATVGQVAVPTGWTLNHSMAVISLLAAVAAGAGVWGFLLRRQVTVQARRLQERLEREAALERSFRELFEQAHDLIFTLDT